MISSSFDSLQVVLLRAMRFSELLKEEENSVWYQFSCDSLATKSDRWKQLYEFDKRVNGHAVKGGEIRKKLKKSLVQFQSNRCCYCKRGFQNISYAKPLEHVLSRKSYPQFSVLFQNLALCCYDCNLQKGDANWSGFPSTLKYYPFSKEMFNFFHPQFHDFDDHVQFLRFETNNVAVSAYIGISEIGKKLCADLLDTVSRKEFLINNNARLSEVHATITEFGDSLNEIELASFDDAYRAIGNAILGDWQ